MADLYRGESFQGLADLRKALRGIDKDAEKELRKALRPAAKVVQDEAKRRAPKRTGALRRGIRARVVGAGNRFRAEVVSKRYAEVPRNPYSHRKINPKRNRRYPIPYPVHNRIEFEGGAPAPGGIGKLPGPRGYLFPAREDKRDEVRELAMKAVMDAINKWTR